jgi:hypothetical protein
MMTDFREEVAKQEARPPVIEKMEPGVGGLWSIDPTAMFLASMAISLKRLADYLEKRPNA